MEKYCLIQKGSGKVLHNHKEVKEQFKDLWF